MAQYRCSIKPNISRSAGKALANSAAYVLRADLTDSRTGLRYNYTNHPSKALFTGIYAPKDAPDWARDPHQLVDAIDAAEKRSDAQLVRPLEVNLPHELTLEQQRYLLQDFIRENFTRKGFVVMAAIHQPDAGRDERNVHAHLLISLRTIDADGFSSDKSQEQENYRNRHAYTAALRTSWAQLGARHLTRHGFALEGERWAEGDKTLSAQRAAALERSDHQWAEHCNREADTHLGVAAAAMKRKGQRTTRGAEYEATVERNQLRAELAELDKQQRHLDRHLTRLESLELEQAQQQTAGAEQQQRGTTHYAIDKLEQLAETQARQGVPDAAAEEAAKRKAFEEAFRHAQDDDEHRLRR